MLGLSVILVVAGGLVMAAGIVVLAYFTVRHYRHNPGEPEERGDET